MAISNMATRGLMALEQPRMGRVMRRPQHTFQLRTRPYQIQPFLLAPVIPGETLKNMLFQSKVISDPIVNRLLGWWKEYYFFYVKLTDLDERDEFKEMVLNPAWDKAGISDAADSAHYYTYANATHVQIPWVRMCLKRVVEEYFRDEGDPWDGVTLTNLPQAYESGGRGIWQSAQPEAAVTFRDVSLTVGVDDSFTMGELDDMRLQYELLRQNGMSQEMSYEDYLRSFGIRAPETEKPHRPEFIRMFRKWSTPVSAIDPTDGSAASAVTWEFTERADKDRFCREPGFIFGVTVTRPKIYFGRQRGVASAVLDNVRAWLPQILSEDPNTSLKLIPDNAAPAGDNTDAGGTWVDVKDLFLYGDQFINYAISDTASHLVALPSVALERKYVDSSSINSMFVDAAGGNNLIREDGIATLNIAGRQRDTSS